MTFGVAAARARASDGRERVLVAMSGGVDSSVAAAFEHDHADTALGEVERRARSMHAGSDHHDIADSVMTLSRSA